MGIPGGRKQVFVIALYAAVLAAVGFLLFYKLDSHLLWGDEAETAVLAKNITHYGVPKTFDGVNRITLFGEKLDENKDNIWTWSPWLQEYVAAAGLMLFGPTTWASRVLFALFGWLSVGLLAVVAHRIYRDHWVTLSSVVLMGTSEAFLLHARQCRYYSVSVFGEMMLIYGIHQLLHQNRKGAFTVAAALILQFYSNYIIAAANLPILLVVALSLFSEKKSAAVPVLVSLALVAAACLPWLLYIDLFRQFQAIVDQDKASKAGEYLREFHFHIMPWIFVLLPGIAWAAARYYSKPETPLAKGDSAGQTSEGTGAITRLEKYLLILFPYYFAVLLFPPGPHLRYILPLLPIACLLTAAWLCRQVRWRAVVAAVILIQCTSNLFALATAYPWRGRHEVRSPLLAYVGGLRGDYHDRFSDVLNFLNREARPGQSLWVFDPEFPLMFYTRLKIIDGGVNDGMIPVPWPDWILSESASGVIYDKPIVLPPNVSLRYETIAIPVHNSFRGGVVPDPDVYQYRTTEAGAYYVLYKKKEVLPK